MKVRPNFRNRTAWKGDNLDILRGMNSESVELIYLDRPFNSNRHYSRAHRELGRRGGFQGCVDAGRC